MTTESRWKPKACVECGTTFQPNSGRQKYCKDCGRRGSGICEQCGKKFRRTGHSTGRFCSSACWYLANTGENMRQRACEVCGAIFKPRRSDQRTCSKRCWATLRRRETPLYERDCIVCGKRFSPPRGKRGKAQQVCSISCASKHRWTHTSPIGSRRIDRWGYVLVKVGAEYNGPRKKGGWMLEHRYVMEQQLGRPLERHETVHHKDGNRQNNEPSNLELRTGSHGPGQRVNDLQAEIERLRAENERLKAELERNL